jgi:hypothetical protein
VAEVTGDGTLPKADRKRLQIEHAHHISSDAVLAKLEDKSVVSTGQRRTQWRAAKDERETAAYLDAHSHSKLRHRRALPLFQSVSAIGRVSDTSAASLVSAGARRASLIRRDAIRRPTRGKKCEI